MAHKKEKKVIKKESSSEVLVNRKDYLRENLIEHLKEVAPELERKFDMFKVCEYFHTRGSFRIFMDGDFKAEDKKVFREICQDLKKEGVLLHVGGPWWARLE